MTERGLSRRTVLDALGVAGSTSLAGCGQLLGRGSPNAPAETVEPDRARELAESYAPTLAFDAFETWFPTDPRPYASEAEGETTVHGFDAVEGYLGDGSTDDPPNPTVFYHVVQYADSPLAVVQYWMYSVFDQFTTNFHWHDWEVLHAFVDTDDAAPVLYVASAHSRTVPNNEHIDPEGPPRILAELGSHSSAMSLNEDPDSFQRLPTGDLLADVTNRGVSSIERLADFPLAYGLPRDEGYALPFAVPELDGTPLYEHEGVPSLSREHLVPRELTVSSFSELTDPPTDLPRREPGTEFGPDSDADVTYELVPTTEVEHIDAFEGPQLSFEFQIPEAVEDAVAKHITTAGTPWDQDRYSDPATDITDPFHRQELGERYDAVSAGGSASRLVGRLEQVLPEEEAPDGEGVSTGALAMEAFVLIESEPTAAPTFGGVAAFTDVPEGEHRLTVNGAGIAPHAERVEVSGTSAAGVDGSLPMVANADAVKLEVPAGEAAEDLVSFSVADDFSGELYRTRLAGDDAVYVHRGGAYSAEVRDAAGRPGAFRVNPAPDRTGPVTVDEPRTGKEPLARFLVDIMAETETTVSEREGGQAGVNGLLQALAAVRESAERAVARAENGNGRGANDRLDGVIARLETVTEALTTASVSAEVELAVGKRRDIARSRAEQAKRTEI